jgi:hypothetical protein
MPCPRGRIYLCGLHKEAQYDFYLCHKITGRTTDRPRTRNTFRRAAYDDMSSVEVFSDQVPSEI